MSEPDRPAPTDAGSWPTQDDPEVTRVVPRRPPTPGDEAAVTQQVGETVAGASDAPGASEASEAVTETADAGEAAPAPDAPAPAEGSSSFGAAESSAWPSPTPNPVDPGWSGSESGGAPSGSATGPHQAMPPSGPTTGSPSAPAGGPPSGTVTGPGATPPGPSAPPSGPSPALGPHGGFGPPADADRTSTIPPAGPTDPNATTYLGAPTASYPGPGSTGPQPFPASGPGYSYRQMPGYGQPPTGSGPQLIEPPPTTNVVLPPVRLPKAESRVALNILGAIVGLILVIGGLVLVLLFQGKMRSLDAGGLDALSVVLTIVGVLLIAVAALLAAWASWAAILPGFLLAAVSVWAMITTGPNSGGALIDRGTGWAFKDGQFASFCANGGGLLVGLVLFAAGLAAVFLRAGVRRTIRQQLESIQS